MTGELGLAMLAYDLRRILDLVGIRRLMDQLGHRKAAVVRPG